MAKEILPYDDSGESKKQQVRSMFDTISDKYDGLNRVISLGIDRRWRKRLVGLVTATDPDSVLDIATGTGDLALALARKGVAEVVGLDLAPGMLEVGRRKVRDSGLDGRIEMVLGDSEALEFPDNRFDAVTVAFGVRNFEDLEKGLAEIYRVLRPGGTLAVLETSVPEKQPFRWGYNLYCRYFLPRVGRWFSKDPSAYSYLSRSAAAFPHGERFNNILGKIGFIAMEHRPQTFGAAAIYTATK